MKLLRRGNIYQFRKAIPKDLRPILSAHDWRCSLQTSDLRLARLRSLAMHEATFRILDRVRELHTARPDDAVKIRILATTLLEKARAETNSVLPLKWVKSLEHQLSELKYLIGNHASTPLMFDNPRLRAEAQTLALNVIDDAKQTVSGTPWQFEAQMHSLSRLKKEVLAIDMSDQLTSRGIEEIINQAMARMETTIAESHTRRFSDTSLSVKIEEYKAHILPELNGKHKDDVPRRLDFFLKVVGDRPVRDVTRQHLKDYRDLLDELPNNLKDGLDATNARAVIEENKLRKKPHPAIAADTVDLKYLGPVRRFFEELTRDRDIEFNPAEGVASRRSRAERKQWAPNTKRVPFSVPELNAILAVTSKLSRAKSDYWTVPCLLYTGMRLNEFAQLRTDDLVQHNGRSHLSILYRFDPEEDKDFFSKREMDERRVKSASARRLIPIHPVLIEIGFVDFIKSRIVKRGKSESVFAECTPDKYGYYSGPLGKRLNPKITKAGVKKTRTKCVYSLRHNFAEASSIPPIQERTKNKWMGHLIEGVPGIYGNPAPEADESRAIELVAYPGLDLSGYLRPL